MASGNGYLATQSDLCTMLGGELREAISPARNCTMGGRSVQYADGAALRKRRCLPGRRIRQAQKRDIRLI
ncbi:hypothetical protein SDC9_190605 [bioreactor metagenome]|uniref:Uncharacterized protein n=1 Tax=bioreactor metagenome TaxID=1076179 RepID=A0A645HWT1_9ZZZZ